MFPVVSPRIRRRSDGGAPCPFCDVLAGAQRGLEVGRGSGVIGFMKRGGDAEAYADVVVKLIRRSGRDAIAGEFVELLGDEAGEITEAGERMLHAPVLGLFADDGQ